MASTGREPSGSAAAPATSSAAPGASEPSSLAPPVKACLVCYKKDCELLRCGRCKSVWFCGRECQLVAFKKQGHKGANCRPAEAVQAREPMDVRRTMLCVRFDGLVTEADKAHMANTRLGYLAAVEKYKEASSVADLIGGAEGACKQFRVEQLLSYNYSSLGDKAAAARAACASL